MGKRIIFHVDVNNAFLSWTALYLLKHGYQVDIRNIPSIIGGDESTRHGIVLAKSMVAKKYGIKTAETLYLAKKKCPTVKVFSPNYEWYYEQSRLFHEYLKKYTPTIQRYSVDEAYLDFTGTSYIYKDYVGLAYKLKREIKELFGFTVNVGIANNMLCAKMASDFEKPDKVHTLFFKEVRSKMWPLPIEDLFMVGKKTAERLKKMGIDTIGKLANADIVLLRKHFKNQAQFLKDSANGVDYNKVEKLETKNPSISVSETLPKDITDLSLLEDVLFRQASEVSSQLRSKNKYCNTVAIIYKNSSFKSYSKQTKLENSTNDTGKIFKEAKQLLKIGWRQDPIRLIGLRLADLTDCAHKQISLFEQEDYRGDTEQFQRTIDEINNKFGANTLIPASIIKKDD
ncbi:MAG: DNA polymerase IV [Bacilli bacterium]|nr:DNA polymerase IV [Bacilli bacterium]